MIQFKRAILAGLVGGLVALIVAVGGALALRLDPNVRDTLVGSPITQLPLAAWLLVTVAALAGAMAIAVGYAFVFELVTRAATWWIGAAMGVLQAGGLWLALGMLAGVLPSIGLVIAGELSLVYNDLFTVGWLVAFHVAYGAAVAVVYGPTKHRASSQTIVRWHELVRTEKRAD